MTVGATLVASLLLALARPRTWPLALATFLLRGGILVVLAPIVVLPSAVAVGNVLTPLLSNVVFRGVASIALPLAVVGLGALLWLFGGGPRRGRRRSRSWSERSPRTTRRGPRVGRRAAWPRPRTRPGAC